MPAAETGLQPLLTADDLCRLFRYSKASWTALKRRLQRAGFPDPAIGAGTRAARWDAAAVRAWLDRSGGLASQATTGEADEQARIDRLLDQRANEIAAE